MTAFSISEFRTFCESKPADEEYTYGCLDDPLCKFSPEADGNDAGYLEADDAAFARPRTFGALASRLREAGAAS